jgi:hypothetical protein
MMQVLERPGVHGVYLLPVEMKARSSLAAVKTFKLKNPKLQQPAARWYWTCSTLSNKYATGLCHPASPLGHRVGACCRASLERAACGGSDSQNTESPRKR